MLKKFHNIKLNSLSQKILNFWEKDFDKSIKKNIKFLKENIENQNRYSQKFSEIFREMDIFQNEDNDENQEENHEDGQNNQSNESENSDTEDNKDQSQEEETDASLDSDYDINEYKLDEQLIDTDSDKQSNEEVVQKINKSNLNLEYKIFTNKYDEITKQKIRKF